MDDTIQRLRYLADQIEHMLTPIAFNCGCQGMEITCANVIEDPKAHVQRNTAQRAADIVRNFAFRLEAPND